LATRHPHSFPTRRSSDLEWGPNGEFGAEAGARRAFGRSARELTLREAALLAAILPNPIRRSATRPRPILLRLAALYEVRALRSRSEEHTSELQSRSDIVS